MPRNDQGIRQWILLRRLEASAGVTLDELMGWILSFGSQVKVHRPDVLALKVKDEARKILKF